VRAAGGALVVVDHRGGLPGPVAEHLGDRGPFPRIGRQLVGRLAAHQDRGVASAAGQRPRRSKRSGVGTVHEVVGDRGIECLEGLGGAQLGDPAGVLQLEDLDRPLDVGQAPAPELEVRRGVGAARHPLGVDPRLIRRISVRSFSLRPAAG
jgi:hypothetical protein